MQIYLDIFYKQIYGFFIGLCFFYISTLFDNIISAFIVYRLCIQLYYTGLISFLHIIKGGLFAPLYIGMVFLYKILHHYFVFLSVSIAIISSSSSSSKPNSRFSPHDGHFISPTDNNVSSRFITSPQAGQVVS